MTERKYNNIRDLANGAFPQRNYVGREELWKPDRARCEAAIVQGIRDELTYRLGSLDNLIAKYGQDSCLQLSGPCDSLNAAYKEIKVRISELAGSEEGSR